MLDLSLEEILNATEGRLIYNGSTLQRIKAVSINSRQITPGALFVAIKGPHFDGHDFVQQAVGSGAVAIIVDQDIPISQAVAVIRVRDTVKAFGDIASYYRNKWSMPLIGITGSNGKTSTKDLIAAILKLRWSIVKTEGNFNNEIGLPLTLFKIAASTQAAVVEMGMRGLGQIRRLAELAQPSIGVVTNVGLSHLELLGTQENIAKAKAELVQSLPEKGLAVLNGDDRWVREMALLSVARTVFYGIDGSNLHYRATDIEMDDYGCKFRVVTAEEEFECRLAIPGRHNILNALAAIAVAKELGIDTYAIRLGLTQPDLTAQRMKIISGNGYWVIDDTYNASPASIKSALDFLANSHLGQRKLAVLGDMLELGPQSPKIHREIGEYAAKQNIFHLMAYGEFARDYMIGFNNVIGRSGQYFVKKSLLIEELKKIVRTDDVILVKGSRSMKMEEVVDALHRKEPH